MIERILIVVAMTFIFMSCDKKDDESSKLVLGDVHMTDNNGQPIGGGTDAAEWQINSTFPDEIEQQFILEDTVCEDAGEMFPAYPNPVGDVLTFTFYLDITSSAEIILFDSCYNQVRSINDQTFAMGTNSFSIDVADLVSNSTYRMYYRFASQECTISGYGDILKK